MSHEISFNLPAGTTAGPIVINSDEAPKNVSARCKECGETSFYVPTTGTVAAFGDGYFELEIVDGKVVEPTLSDLEVEDWESDYDDGYQPGEMGEFRCRECDAGSDDLADLIVMHDDDLGAKENAEIKALVAEMEQDGLTHREISAAIPGYYQYSDCNCRLCRMIQNDGNDIGEIGGMDELRERAKQRMEHSRADRMAELERQLEALRQAA